MLATAAAAASGTVIIAVASAASAAQSSQCAEYGVSAIPSSGTVSIATDASSTDGHSDCFPRYDSVIGVFNDAAASSTAAATAAATAATSNNKRSHGRDTRRHHPIPRQGE